MNIKVCGITSIEQMQQLQELGIDYAGMVLYESSKRFAGGKLKDQKSAIRNLDIKKVGVFVNADFESITKAVDEYDLYAVQLHGDETDEFCMELMDKTKVIKVFRIADHTDIDTLIEPFQNACDFFLFDTAHPGLPEGKETHAQPLLIQEKAKETGYPKSDGCAAGGPSHREGSGMGFPVYGGTGKQFDWNILQKTKINKPFFLSGGIGVDDIEKIKNFLHPYLYAADINSRFETAPGVKDMVAVKKFMSGLNPEGCDTRDDK
jgi:phosphoribosylanthranilate isomerase